MKSTTSAALLPAFIDGTLALYHWVPKSGGVNFGDEISPMVVERLLRNAGRDRVTIVQAQPNRHKLLAIGSIVQFARNGDVVWGSGVNGKSWPGNLVGHKNISVRCVRGPLTADALRQHGIGCPDIYGDPGLLFPTLFAEEIAAEPVSEAAPVLYIPNLNDDRYAPAVTQQLDSAVLRVSPEEHPIRVASLVSRAELVIASSLHGVVLADAFGVPCRPVASLFEPLYKYADYFAGTGRPRAPIYRDVGEALFAPDLSPAIFDSEAIAGAFPFDLVPD